MSRRALCQWVILLLPLLWMGCSRPIKQVRLDRMAEPTPAEKEAAARNPDDHCGRLAPIVYPGVGPVCRGQDELGAGLAALGTAEIGAGFALMTAPGTEGDGFTDAGRQVPWVLAQDTWISSWGMTVLDRQRGARLRYVPADDFGDLVAAPFNPRVLRKPVVWGGTLALVGGAMVYGSLLPSESAAPPPRVQPQPNLFGQSFDPSVGYPLAMGTTGFVVEHIAIAEEIAFRGLLQSSITRDLGEVGGWLLSSAIFGSVHALNIVVIPDQEDQIAYLTQSLPYITLTGTWIGHTYRVNRYSLTAPVAIHFWYDAILVAGQYLLAPDDNFFSIRIGGDF